MGIQRTQIIENSGGKKAVRIITLSGYSSHSEPLFKQLNVLKIADQLRLQELKFYFKYIHKNLPAYLLDWDLFQTLTYTFMIHEHPAKSTPLELNKNSPTMSENTTYHISINATPAIVVENIQTHGLRGFTTYAKQFLIENIQIHVRYKIVIPVINIIISY